MKDTIIRYILKHIKDFYALGVPYRTFDTSVFYTTNAFDFRPASAKTYEQLINEAESVKKDKERYDLALSNVKNGIANIQDVDFLNRFIEDPSRSSGFNSFTTGYNPGLKTQLKELLMKVEILEEYQEYLKAIEDFRKNG